jgi:similar to spore coat protein
VKKLNTILENLTGMNAMSDQVIANDLLFASKTGIKSLAVAITEASSPEVTSILRKQLDDAITSHDRISALMMNKGWYHSKNIEEQVRLDIKNAQTALKLPE